METYSLIVTSVLGLMVCLAAIVLLLICLRIAFAEVWKWMEVYLRFFWWTITWWQYKNKDRRARTTVFRAILKEFPDCPIEDRKVIAEDAAKWIERNSMSVPWYVEQAIRGYVTDTVLNDPEKTPDIKVEE